MRYWLASFYGNSVYGNSASASGSRETYGRVFKVRKSNKELSKKLEFLTGRGFSYSWPDGWWIGVEFVELDDVKTYKKIRKSIRGEHGYGWVIDNILDHGTPEDLDEKFMQRVIEGNEYYLKASEVFESK